MTKIEILKEVILKAFYYTKAYFITFLIPAIKEAFIETKNKFPEYIKEIKEYFVVTLWEKIKPDIQEHLEMAIQEVEIYFASASYEMKEKIIIDYIFEHIHLPLLLRPTKLIAKSILRNKIREFIANKLKNLHKLNTTI